MKVAGHLRVDLREVMLEVPGRRVLGSKSIVSSHFGENLESMLLLVANWLAELRPQEISDCAVCLSHVLE